MIFRGPSGSGRRGAGVEGPTADPGGEVSPDGDVHRRRAGVLGLDPDRGAEPDVGQPAGAQVDDLEAGLRGRIGSGRRSECVREVRVAQGVVQPLPVLEGGPCLKKVPHRTPLCAQTRLPRCPILVSGVVTVPQRGTRPPHGLGASSGQELRPADSGPRRSVLRCWSFTSHRGGGQRRPPERSRRRDDALHDAGGRVRRHARAG